MKEAVERDENFSEKIQAHLDSALEVYNRAWKDWTQERGWNADGAAHGADNNTEHIILLCLPFLPSHRRLLTQLEAAKGSRGSTAGDGKLTASAKGPDGVVLYELHSRPEQEKFNESAKVKEREMEAAE